MANWVVFVGFVVAALLLRGQGRSWPRTIGTLALVTLLSMVVVGVLGVLLD